MGRNSDGFLNGGVRGNENAASMQYALPVNRYCHLELLTVQEVFPMALVYSSKDHGEGEASCIGCSHSEQSMPERKGKKNNCHNESLSPLG